MILIIGGKYHGKKEFILKYFSEDDIYDVNTRNSMDFKNYKVIYNAQLLPKEYVEKNLGEFKNHIVIGDEIGLGIVPIEKEARIHRDDVGRMYQEFTKNSDVVIRVWYGTHTYLKSSSVEFEKIIGGEQ